MSAFELFEEAFNKITNEVEFSLTFANGTGYFNGLAEADLPNLKAGDRFKTTAHAPDSRRIIGIVTPVGNVVFFERYTASTGSAEVIVSNLPHALSGLYLSGAVENNTLFTAIGGADGLSRNIGTILGRTVAEASIIARHKQFNTPGDVIRDVLNAAEPAVVLEVIDQWKVEYKQHVSPDAASRGFRITEEHGGRGVSCKVIPD